MKLTLYQILIILPFWLSTCGLMYHFGYERKKREEIASKLINELKNIK